MTINMDRNIKSFSFKQNDTFILAFRKLNSLTVERKKLSSALLKQPVMLNTNINMNYCFIEKKRFSK